MSFFWYMVTEKGEPIQRHLSPREELGVLQGWVQAINFTKMNPKIPADKAQLHFLGSTCTACNGMTVKLFEEYNS